MPQVPGVKLEKGGWIMGRPWKYAGFIEALEDGVLYTPVAVFNHGLVMGVQLKIDGWPENGDQATIKECNARVRSALRNFVSAHLGEPDGFIAVTKPYVTQYRAWYGQTWKAALRASKAPKSN